MWAKLMHPLRRINFGKFSLDRFIKGEGPFPSPLTLSQRRIFILPTPQGLFFAVLLLVMLIGSINYSNSLGFALTFLLASINVISILHTFRNLLHLKVSITQIDPQFCPQPVKIPVILDNAGHRPRYALALNFDKSSPVYCDIQSNGWKRVDLALPARKRGRHHLQRIIIHSTFPLGLFRAWSYVRLDHSYLVYPKPVGDLEPSVQAAQAGNTNEGDSKQGMDDFAGLRTYHSGDSLRHVHWKTAARAQGLYTKHFAGASQRDLWFYWDALPELDTESKLSQLCRWIVDAHEAQQSYGLALPGRTIAPNHGPSHRHQCLEALALYGQREELKA
jgi:uncharacterized protein (DUF58 family)